MRSFGPAAIILFLAATPLAAQEEQEALDFGDDSFRAGGTVVFEATGTDDLFMAGETLRAQADISGSAHLAGRRVTMAGDVGQDAYLAGMDVVLEGEVAGDATLAGYDVRVGPVGGDLRVSGSKLSLEGAVAGYALVAGEKVRIDSVLNGDVGLSARELEFGEGARIEGRLILYEESQGTLEIPETVVPAERVERRDMSAWHDAAGERRGIGWAAAIGSFVTGVLVVSALAALIAAIIPQTLADMRRDLLARPFRNLGIGFVTQSALVGSAVLFALTIIGIFLSPAAVLVALLAGFAGYVVGVYAFGVGLLLAFGRPEPGSIGQRAVAGGIGALVAGLIALIPLLGWLFVLALVLAGIGAIMTRLLHRENAPAA
ncbi:hypothetical protein SAMN05444722_1044 [Rhodovulum sp. ES.010]|uniref:polymer-forming cytoskeletal protein n=1 Tax=Rhodovulum sp. ES.010 TaxID=1882821 RepID=UPI000929843C|nr:polymer-forming cytoskeletal protein [Rhodovulum sp. ES.010]SIO25538.1 hypothetical protein SAMN05444722_1044 [Rhodovulum sp. ES.010]